MKLATKAEFARICGVSRATVGRWIKGRLVGGDALAGTGRNQKIRVEAAKRQLRVRRDSGQAMGNGLDTRLKPGQDATPAGEANDAIDEQLKQARLEALERRNRVEAEREAHSLGRYTETASARREMGRVAAQMLRVFEGALPAFATALHGRFQIEQREILLLLREEFRAVRSQAAQAAARLAEQQLALLPEEE